MLSIVIPTLNEEENIEKTLLKIEKISKEIILDIIIVDDDSKDNTFKIAEKFTSKLDIRIINNTKNLGLGYALNEGYKLSTYPFVMFLDADLSVSQSDIIKLFKSRKVNSIVIGSRYIEGSKVLGANIKKVFISRLLNLIISKMFRLKVTDISHSFRIISKKINLVAENFSHPGFFWETTINAKKNGFTLDEIPITFNERIHGTSKNKSILMLKSVIKSLFNILK